MSTSKLGWARGMFPRRLKRRASIFALLALGASGGCSSEEELQGRIFLSEISSADGTAVGVAIDFIPTEGHFAPGKVAVMIDVRGDTLMSGSQDVSSICLPLDAKRMNLLASDGKLDATTRMRVQAFRINSQSRGGGEVQGGAANAGGVAGSATAGSATAGSATAGSATAGSADRNSGASVAGAAGTGGSASNGGSAGNGSGGMAATAGSGGGPAPAASGGSAAADPRCTGEFLDDAVWPTRGAQVVIINTGGSSGTAGNGGTAGNSGTGGTTPVAGAGGMPTGGEGGTGGAPIGGEGGTGGDPQGGAGGDNASGQGGGP